MALPKEYDQRVADCGTARQAEYYKLWCELGSRRKVAEKLSRSRRVVDKSLVALEKKAAVKRLTHEPASKFSDACGRLDARDRRISSMHLANSHEFTVFASDTVGIIGDVHAPFAHPMYLRFLADMFDKWGVTKVMCIGDLIDNHAISRHISEPDALGAMEEYDETRAYVAELLSVFPNAGMTKGNHDDIPTRQAKDLGIPAAFVRNMREVWGLPQTWVIKDSFTVGDVHYFHGTGSAGMHAAYNRAKANAISTVQGHIHSNGGVKYISNQQKVWFGMDTGCGIDIDRYAFRYGKACPRRPMLGCGIVKSAEEAYFLPMDATGEYNRHRA